MIEKIQNLHWKWNGKLEPIGKMHHNKLTFIRNFVMSNRGYYSNMSSEEWSENIKYLMDFRKIKNKHYNIVEKVSLIITNKMS